MPSDASKICSKCGLNLSVNCFGKHPTTRDRLRPECKKCHVSITRVWQKKNPSKISEYTKNAKARDPEKFKKRKNNDYQKNKLKRRATARAWVEKNRALVMAANTKWQEANKEKYLMSIRVCNHRKRGRGRITKEMIEKLNELQKNTCVVCRVKLGAKFHLDHIMPLARGGDNSQDNLQLLCPHCNQQKKDRHPVEFMQSKGLLL